MPRNLQQQYDYETKVRGLSHDDALGQMKWMFTPEQLATLSAAKRIVELSFKCLECGEIIPFDDIDQDGEECPECGGGDIELT